MTSAFRFRAAFAVLVLLAASTTAAAAQSSNVPQFAFLRLEPSARAAALAGSFSMLPGDDANGLFYNPALLNENMGGAVSLSYVNHLADLNAGVLAYAHDVRGVGTFGAGVRFLSWGEIDQADEQGEVTGTFSPSDVALTLGVGRTYDDRFRYGANVHAVYSGVAGYSATALAADLGASYHLEGAGFAVGVSLHNFGRTLSSLGAERDELPQDLRLNVSKRLQHVPLTLSITGYNLNQLENVPAGTPAVGKALHFVLLGGEFRFAEAFQVRFGYNHRRHEALKTKDRLDLAGASAGVGIKVARVRVDYAYNTWSEAGALHQLTVRTKL